MQTFNRIRHDPESGLALLVPFHSTRDSELSPVVRWGRLPPNL